jgi:hypothetical protein
VSGLEWLQRKMFDIKWDYFQNLKLTFYAQKVDARYWKVKNSPDYLNVSKGL